MTADLSTTTYLHPKSTAATRTVTARRYTFDHDAVGTHRHWLDGDVLGSHLVATLSGVIPPGERFFADTIRRQRDLVEGPLRDQINGFIGQERLHQREHELFNEALARIGYPTAAIDRASAFTFRVAARLPARLQVAIAAAIEHWTAVIAEHSLADDQLGQWDIADEARAFLDWHLLEELEHRAVAFDVMQAMGTREPQRILAMHLATAMMIPSVVGGFLLSLTRDPATRRPRRVLRSLRRLRSSPFASRAFLVDLVSWSRPGFHPDERDIDELLERWRIALFADDGLVTIHSAAKDNAGRQVG